MMKKVWLVFAVLVLLIFSSCEDSETLLVGPEIPVDPEYEYKETKNVSDVAGLIDALESLTDNTEIILAEGVYDFEGASTDLTLEGQTGWMIPVTCNNVLIRAAEGAEVKICSTDTIPNGAYASQTIVYVTGENFIMDGITVGVRGSENKSIEIASRSSIIRNCKFVDGACLYVSSTDAVNTTVRNCSFDEGCTISFSDGATILRLYENTFTAGSFMYFTGKRDSGWNNNTINLSSVDFIGNVFEVGSGVVLKATEDDYKTCFANFDPEKLFGMTLSETEEPSETTYNAIVNTYVVK